MPRAVSPAVGAVLLTALTVVIAGIVGLAAVALVPGSGPADPLVLAGSADVATGRIVLVHRAGPTVDVRRVRVRISVGGERLRHQPPVPFVGARGFAGAPSGPFNPAADPRWTVGERAALRLAGTNDPQLTAGAAVLVEVSRDGRPVARAEITAR